MATRTASEPRSGCPINAAMEVIGDRWPLLVLRDVMFGNRRHFRVLEESSEEGIARTFSPTACGGSCLAGLLMRRTSAAVGARPTASPRRRSSWSRCWPCSASGACATANHPDAARTSRTTSRRRPRAVGGLRGRAAQRAPGGVTAKTLLRHSQLYVVKGARGRETWYGRWRTGERKINRRIGGKRATGTRMGLTRARPSANCNG